MKGLDRILGGGSKTSRNESTSEMSHDFRPTLRHAKLDAPDFLLDAVERAVFRSKLETELEEGRAIGYGAKCPSLTSSSSLGTIHRILLVECSSASSSEEVENR